MRPSLLTSALCWSSALCWIVLLAELAHPAFGADSAPPLPEPQLVDRRSSPVTISSVTIGFEGRYKSGYWTPVRATLQAGSRPFHGELQLIVPDGDGVATRFRWSDLPPVEVPAGESRSFVRLVKMGRVRETLVVEARQGAEVAARFELAVANVAPPVSPERALILAYGPSLAIAQAIGRTSRAATQVEICELSGPEQFPIHWLGLDAVDTVLLTTSDLARMQAISTAQLAALHEWVVHGGRLVWCVGKNGRELLGDQGRFTNLAPGKFREVASLRNVSPLEAYTDSTQRLPVAAGNSSGLPFTVLTDVDGKVELVDTALGASRPLIVRSSLGLGQTIFIALDLDLPPLANWDGRPRIVNRMLQDATAEIERRLAVGTATQVTSFGYQDIVGQLRSALDQFPQVTFVGFSWVAGLVSLYVLMIGPVDYFLLRDFFRRMTLTWITFPLMTFAFAALALWLAPRWKGSEIRLNQADIVDVDTVTGRVRATTWAHLYSPLAATYQLAGRPRNEMAAALNSYGTVLSWQGLPGTGLGGLATTVAAPPAIDECQLEFLASDSSSRPASISQAVMRSVPIHVAATKSLVECWWGEIQLSGEAALTVDSDGLLRGTVVNPLPIELRECLVYYSSWAYRLDSTRGVLAPGESTRIERELALNLQWRLTGRRALESKDAGTPWDQQTLVVPRILEMMMFHHAAGGETYTQLVHRYQPSIDLSSHLVTNRAILIGRTPVAATQLTVNDRDLMAEQPYAYYRVVFPVTAPRRK